jgi:hypothetical protein
LMGKIIRSISDSIATWDDRVLIRSIKVYQEPDLSSVKIDLFISIRGYDEVFDLSLKF